MEILKEGIKYPKEWVGSFTNVHKFAHLAPDFLYIETRFKLSILDVLKSKNKKIAYFDMEEPNRYFLNDPEFRREKYEFYFDKILTMCPYTAIWLNKKQGKERRMPVFYPIDPDIGPQKMKKEYDVIYSGGLYDPWMFDDVKAISKFNYKFIAHSGILAYKFLANNYFINKIRSKFPKYKIFEAGRKYITESNIPHLEKWNIMSKTKITITHSIVPCPAACLKNIYRADGWQDNEAFRLLPRPNIFSPFKNFIDTLLGKIYLVPQLKSRAFEAALCRSLILCRKDPWNVIERFFEPNKEFVYYEPGKLAEKVKEILADWPKYEIIIENAHKKFIAEYTTQRFFEKYLKNIGF